jgi:Uma2 family endonuclease
MQQEEITDRGLLRIKFISPLFREMTDDEFLLFCELNDPLSFERDKFRNIIAMAPSGVDTSRHTLILSTELSIWNRKNKLGYIFDSSARI